jgi:hypothetical protein
MGYLEGVTPLWGKETEGVHGRKACCSGSSGGSSVAAKTFSPAHQRRMASRSSSITRRAAVSSRSDAGLPLPARACSSPPERFCRTTDVRHRPGRPGAHSSRTRRPRRSCERNRAGVPNRRCTRRQAAVGRACEVNPMLLAHPTPPSSVSAARKASAARSSTENASLTKAALRRSSAVAASFATGTLRPIHRGQ